MPRRKKKPSELKKLPRPITFDHVMSEQAQPLGLVLFAQISPDADEIIEEAKKRGYDEHKDGGVRRKR